MGAGNKRTITKTRRKTRDVDQIKADLLSSRHLDEFKDSKASEDLPSLGRHYCIECARWFNTAATLDVHRGGKPHKRRLKQLREEPDRNPRNIMGAPILNPDDGEDGDGCYAASNGMTWDPAAECERPSTFT
ncbi:hypothetical protein XA68_14952 [Ophiocordyceps unilateralis]|uniref:C2H2-type domain-containing protein n=1 Tax=Ophiocordyceps unilateralis TaxID=268505 RepID=A0A2A9PTN4_OPHUN|nr:hypothetical protein XA68_14952 [Ophiocordyceps unilateralis]